MNTIPDMDKFSDSEDEPQSPSPKSKKKSEKGKKVVEKKSYRCDRCNFSSSSKAKYTKHAKSAHSGSVVQCDHCEFKTPYKWNLDRHYKNHLGGGALCCHLCNFSCDIKQSLTVHLQNHHSNVPEEIIESVKRQQIPPRNQSANKNKSGNNPPTTTQPDSTSVKSIPEVSKPVESPGLSDAEKKVPPLRISRALTGLSVGDENGEEICDFEGVEDGSNVMKKLASQHKKHHKKERASSPSPEYGKSSPSTSSPNIPIVPIPLPPKKSKGSTSPRPGQSASSSNSPAIHRSQSPMKASEAINTFGSGSETHNNLQAAGPSEDGHLNSHTILNLTQPTLKSAGEESAFTPVGSVGDYAHAQLSSLKKPKQRALAQFYQKIKPKLTVTEEEAIHPENDEPDDAQKGSASASKSNRCQYCRQRCKSTADLATHLEKCSEMKKGSESIEKKEISQLPVKPTSKGISQWNGAKAEAEEGEFDKPSQLNGSTGSGTGDVNDDLIDLIGFETGPGVGAIHSGKLEEMEYQGYSKDEEESQEEDRESIENQVSLEDLDDEMEEDGPGKKSGKGKPQITNRKVYRCPENDCSFWATTASRFHVHIVGHYNLKPFECSECHYKSNWRWDVNKHIRLKTPKDPKHAVARTLLTHESGQRDYRKYDNYLVTMSLTHNANAKAPDCSTVATKRTKTPKSSPELHASIPKQSPTGSSSSVSSTPSPPERKQKKGSKKEALTIPRESSPSQDVNQQYQEEHPMDMTSGDAGRSFVETKMLAGGEIYQTSILKHEGDDDSAPTGFDLTLKRSRHPHQDEVKREREDIRAQNLMLPLIPTKKSKLNKQEGERHAFTSISGGAINGSGNKILSMWQCIKCNFKHLSKDVVRAHISDQHKPKKGDPVSILSHNHLIQVVVPEQDADALMASMEYEMGESERKKDVFQSMYNENGKVLSCKYCPFTTGLLYEIEIHAEHHLDKSNSYYGCPHCSYSVAVKSELHEHLKLHGDSLPQQLEIQNRLINSTATDHRMSLLSPSNGLKNLSKKDKKGQCHECPYSTTDLSEFQYHRQCHQPNNYPFKCHKCSFNVSVKLHLLQHLRVHGIQIDEVGVPPLTEYQYSQQTLNTDYESISDDGYSPNGTQEEPLNLSIFANRKPVIVYDTNGVPMEGYKCCMCPQIFQDLNDLKDHEFVSNHRSINTSTISNSSTNFILDRDCESPPMEAMNLSVKLSDQGNRKKSSQAKVNGKRSDQQSHLHTTMSGNNIQAPLSSPSSLSSVEAPLISKAEKEYIYLCDSCPARFFFEKELKIHHTFHENKSTFQCPKCTYSARQKDPHLMSHMRVHGTAYQEKTKALLTKFPRGKVTASSPPSSSAAVAAYQAAATAALSAASLLNLNTSLLNSNFNVQAAAAALVGKNAMGGLDGLRKNGLSIVCPKCPEKFFNAQAFQQHIEQHTNGRGGTEYRCRFCDYWAESRKALVVHEIVHSGQDISIDPAVAKLLSSSVASAFNPVSMMAMVAHQDSPFTSPSPGGIMGASGMTSSVAEPETVDKNAPVPDEAYEGNPEFVYPTYMKNGRVKSKRYKCMKCPSAFEKKDQYHTHIGLHGSNQKYKCTVCDYAVTYYANYIQHLKKHENQRNIPTELLNMGRKRHSEEDGGASLKIAKLTENGENSSSSSSSISANSNGSSFDSNSENHQNGVNNGTPLKCSICPFHCFDGNTFENHLIHHQDNPNWLHVCTNCTFRTSSKKALKEHSKLHMINGFHHVPVNQKVIQPPKFEAKIPQEKPKNGGNYLNGFGRDDIEDISSDGSVL